MFQQVGLSLVKKQKASASLLHPEHRRAPKIVKGQAEVLPFSWRNADGGCSWVLGTSEHQESCGVRRMLARQDTKRLDAWNGLHL